jgi:DNA-binding XRE family transcriptional regulator
MRGSTKGPFYESWKKSGIEQWEFANLIGVNKNTMNSYFNNRILPPVTVAKKIVKVLKDLGVVTDYGLYYTLDDLYDHVMVYEPEKDFVPNRSQKYQTPEFMQHREERRRLNRKRKSKGIITPEHKSVLEVQIEFEEKRRRDAGIEM